MFDRLAGNQRAKSTLRRMLAQRRVPGALLFAGEEGVGKRAFAIELASALNCREPAGAEACERCPSCVRLARFAGANLPDGEAAKQIIWSEHPDVGMIRPAGRFINVPQVREVERESNFRPYEGRARVFLIEEADRLNEAAANALLKTLEEPHETSHLILITPRPASLLPTIRSRCQVVRFAPLPPAEIEALLPTRGPDAALTSRLARGSLGRALSLDLKVYRETRALMLEVLEAAALTRDRVRLLRASEELNDPKRKEAYEENLETLETLVHDLWLMTLTKGRAASLVNEDLRDQLARLGAGVTSPEAARWLARIEELRGQLGVNVNRKVATDALLLSMAGAGEPARA